MLVVDGYKMLDGWLTVRFYGCAPERVRGVFLYRPDKDMWIAAPSEKYPWGATFSREEVVGTEDAEGAKT